MLIGLNSKKRKTKEGCIYLYMYHCRDIVIMIIFY